MTPQDRKTQLLDAAQELLQTRGYTGFSYQDLATRLGIAKPSIHHHFATKEALGLALIHRYAAMLAEMRAHVEGIGGPAAQLRTLFAIGEQEIQDHEKAICPGGALHAEFENLPESMQQATEALSATMHAWLADVFAAGRRLDEIRFDGEPSDQAWLLMAAMQGSRQHARTHGVEVWRAVCRQIEAAILVPDEAENSGVSVADGGPRPSSA